MLVIKIGGGAGITSDAFQAFAEDIATLKEPLLLIHGGNHEFSVLSAALGTPPRMINNDRGRVSRYSDRSTMDAMLMAYCGKVNKTLVALLQQAGVNAVGLSAIDGKIATGQRKPVLRGAEDGKSKVLRDDHAGTIERLDTKLLHLLMSNGYTPVLTPPALAMEEGLPINVDGDKLALELAVELGATRLFFFTDTPGLLADRYDETTLIRHIDANDPAAALVAAKGRMAVKVESAIKAIERGVEQVVFADARVEQPVQKAMNGVGTVIKRAVPTNEQSTLNREGTA